jgi:hypothetical protein
MSYYQHPSVTFDLGRDQHNRLLQEAAQRRLLNTLKSRATSASTFLMRLRGHKQEQAIHDFELTLTSTVN